MRWSQYFIPTLRENPADAEVVSHQLLLRAGYIRQLGAGIYSFLPLAYRSMRKIENIIREEMDAIGGQEFYLPALNPAEVWQESGRWDVMGDNMFRLKDRKGADLCLGMTHEEVFTTIARGELRSYKQLPQIWYQIQLKFRDEPRPKSGLLRVRQFTMKDSYSFDKDFEGLDIAFEKHREAYMKIYDRCGLQYVIVEAHSGSMGGSKSNEFMVYTNAGEDNVASCPKCGYAANTEKAASRIPTVVDDQDPAQPEKFATPGVRTIEALTTFAGGAAADRQIKTLVYIVDEKLTLFLLRGDHQLNEAKLVSATGATHHRPAHAEEIFAALGAHPGSLGAVGVTRFDIYADEALEGRRNMTTGANEDDFHLRGVNIDRDIKVTKWADLRNVESGEGCPICDGTLRVAKALEIGHIFKLGTKYSVSMGANVLNENGEQVPIVMGSYGIGADRILASAVELYNDQAGISFPGSIAPFHVIITPINAKDEKLRAAAEELYSTLIKRSIEVLYDDRDERPGVKFNDADLIGVPFRITIGQKKLADGKVEIVTRSTRQSEDVNIADVPHILAEKLSQAEAPKRGS
ncbi:MAG TPA: proline--tRNA ligase [Blastocatellia bacterium]|nr:proline--tRNA ligase [Blastocatellia bacterium]